STALAGQTLETEEQRHREHAWLPPLVVGLLGAGCDDRAEALHAAEVVDSVRAGHDTGAPFPTSTARLTASTLRQWSRPRRRACVPARGNMRGSSGPWGRRSWSRASPCSHGRSWSGSGTTRSPAS